MTLPSNLKYTSSHEWVRIEADGIVTVGITDFAQEALGDIVFLELPGPGGKFKAGDAIAVIESVKAASDIYAPVAGTVVAVNEDLKKQPEDVNRDAFAAWLFKLKPDDPAAAAGLLDAPAYQALTDAQK